ncbi:MAG: hypothetical protein AABX02_00210, partial [archaeon]
MNVFNLLIAAIVAIVLLFLIYSQFSPYFTSETKIGSLTEGLLNEAQADLGHAKGTFLTLKEGQSLYARNLDSITRTVAFACSTTECCTFIEGCTEPLSVTSDRIVINDTHKASITARCTEINQIHACKVYVGGEPAQVILEKVTVQENVTINGTQELPIIVSVRNTGENTAGNVTVRAEWIENQTIAGVEVPKVIQTNEKTIDVLDGKKDETVELSILMSKLGTYSVRVSVLGEDAGSETKMITIHIAGVEANLCARDLTKKEAAFFDSFDQMCRKKVFCTGCAFTYECRQIWEKEAVITGGFGTGYDPDRGEP